MGPTAIFGRQTCTEPLFFVALTRLDAKLVALSTNRLVSASSTDVVIPIARCDNYEMIFFLYSPRCCLPPRQTFAGALVGVTRGHGVPAAWQEQNSVLNKANGGKNCTEFLFFCTEKQWSACAPKASGTNPWHHSAKLHLKPALATSAALLWVSMGVRNSSACSGCTGGLSRAVEKDVSSNLMILMDTFKVWATERAFGASDAS